METLFWCAGVIWVIGWINELSSVHANMQKYKIEYPSVEVKHTVPVLLLLIWPYFYFYRKSA